MTATHNLNNRALARIGFRLFHDSAGDDASTRTDIEETLLSIVGMFSEDYRLASVLLSWIKVHGNHVIVEKLAKIANRPEHGAVATTWLALAAAWAVECGFHKWRKLARPVPGPVYFYAPDVSEAAIARKGLLSWPEPLGFRIPNSFLRIRESDVLTPAELIAVNPQYRNRYLYGASWRADIHVPVARQAGIVRSGGDGDEQRDRRHGSVADLEALWPSGRSHEQAPGQPAGKMFSCCQRLDGRGLA